MHRIAIHGRFMPPPSEDWKITSRQTVYDILAKLSQLSLLFRLPYGT
jgi:hypothetical protein